MLMQLQKQQTEFKMYRQFLYLLNGWDHATLGLDSYLPKSLKSLETIHWLIRSASTNVVWYCKESNMLQIIRTVGVNIVQIYS